MATECKVVESVLNSELSSSWLGYFKDIIFDAVEVGVIYRSD
ncbi:hypothetical protein [Pseudomonas sp. Irchel 3A5]|nr:hypothetical protein [Pseudomonas sp. Irchel 3A5]